MCFNNLNVRLDNNKIEDYNKVLSAYKEWKSFYRDIKLNTILESKRIQFDIGDIFIMGSVTGNMSLKTIAFIVNEMVFIINNNNIDKLTISGKFTDTEYGTKLKKMYDTGIEFEISQIFNRETLSFNIDIK